MEIKSKYDFNDKVWFKYNSKVACGSIDAMYMNAIYNGDKRKPSVEFFYHIADEKDVIWLSEWKCHATKKELLELL